MLECLSDSFARLGLLCRMTHRHCFAMTWGCAQQVGEHDIVLEYGSKALEKWEARSMRRDILFAMAMAHLGLASDALEAKEKV